MGKMSGDDASVLYHRISDYGNSIVFAREADAVRVDAINQAINTAATWGAFRAMLPEGEWDSIADPMGPDEMDRYADDQPFDAMLLPGYGDGAYPARLMPRMLDFLPNDLAEKYVDVSADMMTGGNVCYIEEGSLADIRRELEERGFIVKDGSHLDYF